MEEEEEEKEVEEEEEDGLWYCPPLLGAAAPETFQHHGEHSRNGAWISAPRTAARWEEPFFFFKVGR